MSSKARVWIVVVVILGGLCAPSVAMGEFVWHPIFLLASLLPVGVLLLLQRRNRITAFLCSGVSVVAVNLLGYDSAGISGDAQGGLALIFVPIYAAGVALTTGLFVIAFEFLFYRRRSSNRPIQR